MCIEVPVRSPKSEKHSNFKHPAYDRRCGVVRCKGAIEFKAETPEGDGSFIRQRVCAQHSNLLDIEDNTTVYRLVWEKTTWTTN